ncbi:MAG: HAD family hydrolase [Sedimentisphaerales bacterium]|nr:HAD family hydrolase [Sedimentisphaerales bacterium]
MSHCYKHIIWDWNGTLIEDVAQCVSVLNRMLSRRNLPTLTIEQYRWQFEFPVLDFYKDLGFDFEQESFENVAHEYHHDYIKLARKCQLHQGTEQILQALNAAGINQSLLSAYQQDRLEEVVDVFGLRKWFVRMIGLNDYYARSKVENGIRWREELPHDPHEILFVGDTLHDWQVAQAMNVDSVLVTYGHQHGDRFKSCQVPLFDSLPQLHDFLLS